MIVVFDRTALYILNALGYTYYCGVAETEPNGMFHRIVGYKVLPFRLFSDAEAYHKNMMEKQSIMCEIFDKDSLSGIPNVVMTELFKIHWEEAIKIESE